MNADQPIKEDPIKIHREGTTLSDLGKYAEASEKFLKASELYETKGNYFDASYTLYKAAECNYLLKDYNIATERFLQAADLALQKAFDRFAVSALEYAIDCYKARGEEAKTVELKQKIEKIKEKTSTF